MNNIVENNRLIAEFLRYKLMPCNNGLAWNSPYQKSIDDKFNLHGRLFHPIGSDYYISGNSYLKFNTDWNWLMGVVEKIESTSKEQSVIQWSRNNWTIFDLKLSEAKIEAVYDACILFITWYNQQSK
jgi:hypothetical protein